MTRRTRIRGDKEGQPVQPRNTRKTRKGGNPDRLGSWGCCEPRKPEQPFQLRITRMARMGREGRKPTTDGHGCWIGCSPGRLPARLWRDPGVACPFPRLSVSIRVHPWLKMAENGRFGGRKSRYFGPKQPENGVFRWFNHETHEIHETQPRMDTDLSRKYLPSVSIRVHPWLKRAEKPKGTGLGAENRDFGSKMGRKRRFQAVFDPFSPAQPVAARFR